MARIDNTSQPSDPKSTSPPIPRVNWHEAAVCAIEIELRDYADILEFHPEYALTKNRYRIDLLIIKALSSQPIPKNIARCFKAYNLFEIKGIRSSVTIDAYYNTLVYANVLLKEINCSEQFSYPDISITFLSFRYPRKLISHLQNIAKFTIEKSSPGIYHISKASFETQIIVLPELPSDENLYLHCLTDNMQDSSMTNRLIEDYAKHTGEEIYNKYLHQLSVAQTKMKGGPFMVCEGIFYLFNTSSAEIFAKGKKESEDFYLPKLNELSVANERLDSVNKQLISVKEQLASEKEQLVSEKEQLASHNDYLENLLKKNNISF